AIIYAIEQINQDKQLLPNIKLGYDLRDTCDTANLASIQALHFITKSIEGDHQTSGYHRNKIVGIVGALRTKGSFAAATILSNFDLAQVSYGSSSRILDDKERFKTFFRTIPSDIYQARALVDIIKYFQWSYVGLLAIDDGYGEMLASTFTSIALQNSICIPVYRTFPLKWTKKHLREIIKQFVKLTEIKVILLFCTETDASAIFEEASRQNLKGKIFIGCDAWGYGRNIANKFPDVIEGALSVAFPFNPLLAFRRYLQRLNICEKENLNPWLFQFLLQQQNNITLGKELDCKLMQELYLQLLQQDSQDPLEYSDFAIDAVYAVAHALHQSLHCNHTACPLHNLDEFKSSDIVNALYNLTFKSVTSNYVYIDGNGPGHGEYTILNHQYDSKSNQFQFKPIGRWEYDLRHENISKLIINNSEVSWSRQQKLPFIPISQCSRDCQPGEYRQYFTDMNCCWNCLPCPINSISNITNAHMCYTCDVGLIPDPTQSQCILVNITYLTISHPLIITLIVIISIGIICVLAVWSVFIKHQQTAIVRASNNLFTNCLLAGILLTYTVPVIIILPISSLTCNLTYITFMTSFAYIMAVILAKTYLLIKIFFPQSRLDKIMRKILCSRSAPQSTIIVIIMTIVTLVQVVVLTADPLMPARYVSNNELVYAYCTANTMSGFGLTISILLALNTMCIIFAYKTRRLPQNFNEARYIYFVSITMCLVLCVIFPSYLVTRGPIQNAIAAFSIFAISTALLACLFVPKIYIIICYPELNT
ncbi:uncharacterized protein TRIADDRAFT_11614, partial [Trichoplax adhaerens]